MPDFYAILKSHLESNPPSFGDGDSVLSMLYEAFAEANPMDDGQLKRDFNDLYQVMNGMPLREMDKIIYPVCTLCRDHQRSGFVEGVRVGPSHSCIAFIDTADFYSHLDYNSKISSAEAIAKAFSSSADN